MFGQILWAVPVAILLMAVAVGWAMRGAMEVRQVATPPHQRRPVAPVRREILTLLSDRKLIFASAFLLAVALFLSARSMDRGLPMMGAVVLAFAYALMCAMVTGFTVWMRVQRNADEDETPTHPESFMWATWVGVGVGAVAVIYLVVDLVASLTA
ncbi:MAG: hypothetical protein Q4P15_01640 [Propionibacteriaceae bacterium]|nr:hypothetical protein [Propionibacteriaceae bacterium]